ncbi:MAG: hypothetical protein QF704_06810, partial [Anaerolineales bacterium]|nr:hypothetical protein [Anaerolineales bacterium]
MIEGQSINGSTYPKVDDTFEFGNSSNRWKQIYTDELIANGTVELGQALYVDSGSNLIGIGIPTPDVALNVSGDIGVTGNITAEAFHGDGSQLTGINSSYLYGQNESDTNNGFVGIKTTEEGILKLNVEQTSVALTVQDNAITTSKLATTDILKTGNFTVSENLTSEDSLLTDFIFKESSAFIQIDNTTFLDDVHILGTLYGGSPLVIGSDLNLTGNITANDGTVLISNDNTGNLTLEDSLYVDYIYNRDLASTLINNLSITNDLHVLGNSYLGSFTIEDDLIIGSNNFSSSDVLIGGGNVGIGTTTPDAKLHIFNETSISNNILLHVENGDINVSRTTGNSDVNIWIDGRDGGDTHNAYLSIAANTASQIPVIDFYNDTTDVASIYLERVSEITTGVTENDLVVASKGEGNRLHLATNSNSRLTIDDSGNVGIGTTAPAYTLHVNKSVDNDWAAQIENAENTAGRNYGLRIVGGSSSADTTLAIEDFNRNSLVTVKGDGNVGIGTTAPTFGLSVAGGNISLGDSSGDNAEFLLGYSSGGGPWNLIGVDADNDASIGDPTGNLNIDIHGGAFNFLDTGTTRMTINSAGNVGIGTTAPQSKLDISLDNTNTGFVGDENQYALNLRNTNTTTNNWVIMTFDDNPGSNAPSAAIGAKFTDHTNNYADLTFGTRSAGGFPADMTIQSGGNVGIGTTSPDVKLQVGMSGAPALPTLGTASGHVALIDDSEDWGMYSGLDNAGGGWIQVMRNEAATAYKLLLNPEGGNVGIGTTSPGDYFTAADNLAVAVASGGSGIT